jgi:hypothetical protein
MNVNVVKSLTDWQTKGTKQLLKILFIKWLLDLREYL